jgi:hypothetical protein
LRISSRFFRFLMLRSIIFSMSSFAGLLIIDHMFFLNSKLPFLTLSRIYTSYEPLKGGSPDSMM